MDIRDKFILSVAVVIIIMGILIGFTGIKFMERIGGRYEKLYSQEF